MIHDQGSAPSRPPRLGRAAPGPEDRRPHRDLNVDLSTVTSAADAVIKVEAPAPWIVHVEFQTGYDKTIPLRLQRYNILVHYREGSPCRASPCSCAREPTARRYRGTSSITLRRVPVSRVPL